jgi:hypothetical protein
MSENTPNSTKNTPNTPPPVQPEPLHITPLAFLPPNISDMRLAQPYSVSSSNPLGRIPTEVELLEELQGQARMAEKSKEMEMRRIPRPGTGRGRKASGGPAT